MQMSQFCPKLVLVQVVGEHQLAPSALPVFQIAKRKALARTETVIDRLAVCLRKRKWKVMSSSNLKKRIGLGQVD
jgi:hypothetical protein